MAYRYHGPFYFFINCSSIGHATYAGAGGANSGNRESCWVGALILKVHPGDAALKFALTSHTIILVYVLFLGLIALALRYTVVK